MSALDDIRAAIVARLTALVDIGQVHAYERLAKETKGFADLYGWAPAGGGQREVRGWNVRRTASRGQAQPGGTLVITAWRLTGFLSMVDLEASAHTADTLADAVAATFRADPGLGGLAIGDPVEGIDGPVLALSRPVMFAGVLCHELQLDWVTEHLEPSAGTG
ncbi:hypothetical protein, partial [Zavarzinia sp.]|uniref:hypothetical protein n=1 Tax=Zavarzinia sp. TaxID=2027920 RepID=UPI003BB7F65C